MMVVEFALKKGLMVSNGNVLSVICKCSTKSEICANTNKLRKEVSHV
jgi:hypothetical protein